MSESQNSLRLDKFLWQARFFKTRGIAVTVISARKVRVNGVKVDKAAHPVRIGDGLTFPQGDQIRVVRVVGLPIRRGPASEAQGLYVDLAAAVAPEMPDAS
jgi:ribosome-associated heat shock protein Hsp15